MYHIIKGNTRKIDIKFRTNVLVLYPIDIKLLPTRLP